MTITRRDLLAGIAAGAAPDAVRQPLCGRRPPSPRRSRATSRRRARPCACCAGRPSSRPRRRPGSPTRRSSPTRRASQVKIDKESWEDIRPKAAVAANVGSGPGHLLGLVRRRPAISRQADGRHRARHLSRRQIWRLVSAVAKATPSATASSSACRSAAIGNAIVLSRKPREGRRLRRDSRRTRRASSNSARR